MVPPEPEAARSAPTPGEALAAHTAAVPAAGGARATLATETAAHAPGSAEHAAIGVALRLLDLMERRRLDDARTCFAPEFEMVFPGPLRFTSLEGMVSASAGRYRSIGKRVEATEAFAAGPRTVVYVRGTLHGVNLHGVPFEGVRFIDRFEVDAGLVRRQDVWNDLAESGVLERRA